jgi:pimeloyl-ACP methyl ester carboxylesterase
VPPPHEGLLERIVTGVRRYVTAEGFDIEAAARGLYDLVTELRKKTGAPQVHLVAHSMGGLVVRCMLQKVCGQDGRVTARELVGRVFTYGTPHGGIAFELGVLDWAQQMLGPAGADIFAPQKMYGYLTPGRTFGDLPRRGEKWDPQVLPSDVFSPDDFFCLIGTDPKDYGAPRAAVGPKSDGLVRIEHAYVRGSHRAFVYRSHSGSYGEVNSEEGYQNLRRFLFGRWGVTVALEGLPAYPADMDELPEDERWPVWQADVRLAVRGLPVVMSDQRAEHWCPIQINDELRRHVDSPDTPVPLVSTFLLSPQHEAELREERGEHPGPPRREGRRRYALTLRVFKLVERAGAFRFVDHLEQVSDWSDVLIVDIGPDEAGTGLQAWLAWNSQVAGANDEIDPISPQSVALQVVDGVPTCSVDLPPTARSLPILGPKARLTMRVTDRETTASATASPTVPGGPPGRTTR